MYVNDENELNKERAKQENLTIFGGSSFKEDTKKALHANLFIARSYVLC